MAMMSIRKSRLTPRQQGRLIEHFVAGSTARAAAAIVGVQPKTGDPLFHGPAPAGCQQVAELSLVWRDGGG